MKRNYLFLIIALVLFTLLFVTSAYAAETKIEADEIGDIHTAIDNAQAQDSVIIDLIADITISSTSNAIKIEKDITVTIDFNGYHIDGNPGSGQAGTVYGMYLNSNGAKLVLNGSTQVDYLNYQEPSDDIVPDYKSNGPAICVFNGSVELNNMYLRQTNTGEWGIIYLSIDGEYKHNFKSTNSIVRVEDNASRYLAVAVRNKTSGPCTESKFEIENSVIYGFGDSGGTDAYMSCGKGSYIKNSRIAKHTVGIDANSPIDGIKATDENALLFENVIFEKADTMLHVHTGRIHLHFVDCVFPDGYKMTYAGDGAGAAKITVTTSATCTEAGTSEYVSNSGTLNADTVLTPVENYNAPALGHEADPDMVNGIYYDSYLENGSLATCIRCGTKMTDENIKADPLFEFLGFSTPEDGSYGIVASFTVNLKAIEQYEKMTGKTLSYGIVASGKQNLGENNPLDKNGNVTVLEKGNVIKAEVSRDYSSYDLVLTGMNENQLDTELVIASYVAVTLKGETTVVYLQGKQVTQDLASTSYNKVIKEQEELQ